MSKWSTVMLLKKRKTINTHVRFSDSLSLTARLSVSSPLSLSHTHTHHINFTLTLLQPLDLLMDFCVWLLPIPETCQLPVRYKINKVQCLLPHFTPVPPWPFHTPLHLPCLYPPTLGSVVQARAVGDVVRGQMITTSTRRGQVDPWLPGAVDSLGHSGLVPRACLLAGHTQE